VVVMMMEHFSVLAYAQVVVEGIFLLEVLPVVVLAAEMALFLLAKFSVLMIKYP